ncbi:hypothetical protein K1719_008819 [Acacia pycnantha]|nr:hypothetical protein K1719_008819 [Acacia pycnantha]
MDKNLLEKNTELVNQEDHLRLTWCVLAKEAKEVCYLAGPMVAVNYSTYFLQTISLMMVGHLGELAQSSTAVSISLCAVTGFSVIFGMASALETLCGQAYGAKQYKKFGVQFQTGIFCVIVCCVPFCVLWLYVGRLLVLVGQDPLIAHEAGKFSVCLIPALFGYAILQVLIRYYLMQSLITPLILSSLITICFHVAFCWTLVFKSSMGRFGGAFAIGTSYWLNVFILALYMKFSDSCAKTRVSISMEIFHGIGEFFRFAIPSAIMICFQWWSYEVGMLLAGLLRPNPGLESSILAVWKAKGERGRIEGSEVTVYGSATQSRKKHAMAKKLNLDDLVDVPIGMARMEEKWLKPMEWTGVSFKASEKSWLSGGLALWLFSTVNIVFVSSSRNFIHVRVDGSAAGWVGCITFFYGPPEKKDSKFGVIEKAQGFILEAVTSDHCPILLCLEYIESRTPWRFKFESFWVDDPEFLLLVRENWCCKIENVDLVSEFERNLAKIKKVLAGWSREKFLANKKLTEELLVQFRGCYTQGWGLEEAKRAREENICLIVGNGLSTRIWGDPWIDPNLGSTTPTQDARKWKVAELISPFGWNLWLIKDYITEAEEKAILSVQLPSRSREDRICWVARNNGEYCVKAGSQLWLNNSYGKWQKVLSQLEKPYGGKVVWFGSSLGLKFDSRNISRMDYWLVNILYDEEYTAKAKALIACLLWQIWKARCDYVFENKVYDPMFVIQIAAELVEFFWNANRWNDEESKIQEPVVKEQSQLMGGSGISFDVTVWCDEVYSSSQSVTGMGILARNSDGRYFCIQRMMVEAMSPFMAEASAMLQGIKCTSLTYTIYSIPESIGSAASTRVSNTLGAGSPQAARVSAFCSMVLMLCEAFIVSSIVFASQTVLGHVFSNEPDVIRYVTDITPILAMPVFVSSVQGTLTGIVRGSGWQHIGAYVNFGSYYVFGIPLAAILGFWVHMRAKGLWIGVTAGTISQVIVLLIVLSCTDWEKEARLARERALKGPSAEPCGLCNVGEHRRYASYKVYDTTLTKSRSCVIYEVMVAVDECRLLLA